MSTRKFAISDIHGCFKTFRALLQKIDFSKADELYLLGDFVDRGPDSKSLIDYIIELQENDYTVFCLRGNHEEMMLNGLNDFHEIGFWIRNGGLNTLESFPVNSIQDIPKKYIDWVSSLSYFFEVDDYILVHAGLKFNTDDPLKDREPMLWARRWYPQIDYEWLGKRIIIHGHTPTDLSTILDDLGNLAQNQRLVIDGGCVYKDRGLGDLIAFEMEQREIFVQKNIEQ